MKSTTDVCDGRGIYPVLVGRSIVYDRNMRWLGHVSNGRIIHRVGYDECVRV